MAYADDAATHSSALKAPALQACGMARAVDLIGDRWTLLIIREALYGVTRFDAMQEALDIPRTVLSGRLKRLCEIGVLTKRAYRDPGQRARHQYVLTAKGVDLALPMMALMQWGEKHALEGGGANEIIERATGRPCRVGLINDSGAPVSIGGAQFRMKA